MNFDEFIRSNYCDFIIANLFLKVNSEKNAAYCGGDRVILRVIELAK